MKSRLLSGAIVFLCVLSLVLSADRFAHAAGYPNLAGSIMVVVVLIAVIQLALG